MIKDKTGLIIGIIGIVILIGAIIYEAQTEKSALFLIVIGLVVNLIGVFIHFKRNVKR